MGVMTFMRFYEVSLALPCGSVIRFHGTAMGVDAADCHGMP